jgi:hypothetical protein
MSNARTIDKYGMKYRLPVIVCIAGLVFAGALYLYAGRSSHVSVQLLSTNQLGFGIFPIVLHRDGAYAHSSHH